jgi:PAS domain S-box-containing protein
MKSLSNIEEIKSLSDKISLLFKQNELLRLAINTSHEGIAILNENGEYIYINEAHAEMFGYTVDELIGKTWEVLYKPNDIEYFKTIVFPVIFANGKWNGKHIGYKKNGDEVNEEVYLTLLPNNYLVCTCRNI